MPANRVPTRLNELRGNPGKRAANKLEPKPPVGAQMPAWISAAAAEHWPQISKQLADAGILTNVDAAALALYCETFATWLDANTQLRTYGALIKSKKTGEPMLSPAIKVVNKSWDQMLRMLVEFGMTPSSRARVNAVPKQEDASSLDEFLH